MKQLLFVLVAIFVVGLGPPVFGETMVLDQIQDNIDGGSRVYASRQLCQTFECGVTGELVMVSMSFSDLSDELAPATISILSTTDGVPNDSDVLWTQDFPSGLAQGWLNVDLSASPPLLQVGQVYGIRLQSTDAVYGNPDDVWDTNYGSGGDAYPEGQLWEKRTGGWQPMSVSGTPYPNADAAFKTYMVEVPEPSAIVLLIALALSIVGIRRSF